jgi:predicted transcriptional regulator
MSYEKYFEKVLNILIESFSQDLKVKVLQKAKIKFEKLNEIISKRGKFYNYLLKVLFSDYYLNRIENGTLLKNEFISFFEFIGVERSEIENEFTKINPAPKFILLPELLKNPGDEYLGELAIFSNNLNVVKIKLRKYNPEILRYVENFFLYSNYEEAENARSLE